MAVRSIVKNRRFYFPYLLTCIFTAAMFYDMLFISDNKGIDKIHGAQMIAIYLNLGAVIIAILSFIFLFYTNSFLMKSRKKELGIYNILGMSKGNLAFMLIIEVIISLAVTLVIGILFGIATSRFMLLLLCYILKFDVQLSFSVSLNSILSTCALFSAIFLITLIYNLISISFSKPVELLRGGNTGEREPKAKWLLSLLGALSLGGGYYIALTVTDPAEAAIYFFLAVLLVIFGTYALFISGSIAVLKLLRKNKAYYYKLKHFTGISGMLYRMKQNAAGLASICILSTMVLVTVSTVVSLNVGFNDIIDRRAPYDISVSVSGDAPDTTGEYKNAVLQKTESAGFKTAEMREIKYFSLMLIKKGENSYGWYMRNGINLKGEYNAFNILPLSSYNRISGKNIKLEENEIICSYYEKKGERHKTLVIGGKEYKADWQEELPIGTRFPTFSVSIISAVMSDDAYNSLYAAQKDAYGEYASTECVEYNMNFDGDEDKKAELGVSVKNMLKGISKNCMVTTRAMQSADFLNAYGGLFFIGIFLGTMFIGFTALIIYYKQISEGLDDRQRYEIMQKVGMSPKEVKSTINSQILKVFFLPLIVAVIHLAFAFKIIFQILSLLGMVNTVLYLICSAGTVLAFALIYMFIYYFTAKAYFKIVNA